MQSLFIILGILPIKWANSRIPLSIYKKALELKPNDEDTKHKFSFVRGKEIKRRIEGREKGRLIKKKKQNGEKGQKNQNAQQNPKGQKINKGPTRSEASPKSKWWEGEGKA